MNTMLWILPIKLKLLGWLKPLIRRSRQPSQSWTILGKCMELISLLREQMACTSSTNTLRKNVWNTSITAKKSERLTVLYSNCSCPIFLNFQGLISLLYKKKCLCCSKSVSIWSRMATILLSYVSIRFGWRRKKLSRRFMKCATCFYWLMMYRWKSTVLNWLLWCLASVQLKPIIY